MNLSNARPGARVRITGFNPGSKTCLKRLLAMGLTPGCECDVMRITPLGGAIQVLLRGFSCALRLSEAAMVRIEQVTHGAHAT